MPSTLVNWSAVSNTRSIDFGENVGGGGGIALVVADTGSGTPTMEVEGRGVGCAVVDRGTARRVSA